MKKNDAVFGMELDVTQLNKVIAAFKQLPQDIATKALKGAHKEGAERIKSAAISLAPVWSGRLSNAITVFTVNKYQPTVFKNMIGVKAGKKRNDTGGAYYAHMVEFGHAIHSAGWQGGKAKSTGTRVPAHPFLEPAIKQQGASVANMVINRSVQVMEDKINKLRVKGSL